jgi:N-formylglutamate amidohydrolase
MLPCWEMRHRRSFTLVLLGVLGWAANLSGQEAPAAPSALPPPPATSAPPATNTELDLEACVRVQRGQLPIIISAPHGGTGEIPNVDVRKGEGLPKGASGFFTGRDVGTEQLALAVAAEVEKRLGQRPWFVISQVHRKYIDFNRPAEIGFEDPDAQPVYDYYHGSLAKACREVAEEFRCGLLLDIHGQGSSRSTVFRGTRNGKTTALLQQRFGQAAQTGEESLFGLLAARGWKVHPNPFSGKEQAGFTGGHIVGTYGSHQQTAIDAVQLEFGADYSNQKARQKTAEVLAEAMVVYFEKYLQTTPQAGRR